MVNGGTGLVITRRQLTTDDLAPLRDHATTLARAAGLDDDRAGRFALAVSELAANTIVHAAGTGDATLIWDGLVTVHARIADRGPGIHADPPDHNRPHDSIGGRGLWLSRHLADTFRIDTGPAGTTVHLTMTAIQHECGTNRYK